MSLLAACSLVLFAAAAPQQPASIEVIGPASPPSEALRTQVEKGEDEFLLFDVGYGVHEAISGLHKEWVSVESRRTNSMRSALSAIQARCEGRDDAAATACASVAAVALALLHSLDRSTLTAAQRDEVRDVESAGPGSMRFLPDAGDVSWIAAQPVGAYAHARRGVAHLAGLYRATIYVGRYLRAWPPATRTAWTEHAAACRAEDVADELVRIERAWSILFGAELDAAGVVVPVAAPDRAWLAGHTHEPVAIDVKLRGLFTAVPVPAPASWSDGVLRLCHELATAPATDPLFGAMAAEEWRAQWCGAAAFAYVGLREVDALAFGPGLASVPARPTVIVEPLPGVWEALRWLQRRHTDVRAVLEPDRPPEKNAAWIDTVLEALALQQQGVDLPAARNEQLADLLLKRFEGSDDGLGIPSRIEGVPTQVRRAVPQLVRVPIRWRGETKKALALRLFVEQEGPGGEWRVPAWSAPVAPAPAVR